MELAGLVVGALPILYSAVRVYRDTKKVSERIFRRQHLLQKLANSLASHRSTVRQAVLKLLKSSGCGNDPDIEKNLFVYLKDPVYQKRLGDFLGPEDGLVFKNSMEEVCEVIRRIVHSIEGVVIDIDMQDSTNSLHLILSSQPQKPRSTVVSPFIRLIFVAGDLDRAVTDLDATLDRFYKFINFFCDNHQAPNYPKLSKRFRQIHGFASRLQAAMSRTFKRKGNNEQGVGLPLAGLPDTTSPVDIIPDTALALSKPSKPGEKGPLPNTAFRFIIKAKFLKARSTWQEIIVEVDDTDNSIDMTVSITVVPQSAGTVVSEGAQSGEDYEELSKMVKEICTKVDGVKEGREKYSLALPWKKRDGLLSSVDEASLEV